jgi:hypothetical protein
MNDDVTRTKNPSPMMLMGILPEKYPELSDDQKMMCVPLLLRPIEPDDIRAARYEAAKRGWRVRKAREKLHTNNFGGLQLIDDKNTVLAGVKYDLTPGEVRELCRKRPANGYACPLFNQVSRSDGPGAAAQVAVAECSTEVGVR